MTRAMLLLLLSSLLFFTHLSDSGFVGVNYGRVADNLPPPTNVVELLKAQGLNHVKLFDADPAVLAALAGTNISAVVTVPNELLADVATNPSRAEQWVQANVAAHHPAVTISAVAVGNEVFANPNKLTTYLVPAMTNIYSALVKCNLDTAVKVSSPVALSSLNTSYPPSAGAFNPDLLETMKQLLDLLRRTNSTLMLNAYPFFAYAANARDIPLDYALFQPNPGVADPATGHRYANLFDAQLDAVYAAMAAIGYADVGVTVSETGWPSKGDPGEVGAGVANAAAYNSGLVRRILSGAGTPLRPSAAPDVYLFALFNEDKKPGPTSERNYGLFYPNEAKVYDISLVARPTAVPMPMMSPSPAPLPSPASALAPARRRTWCMAREGVGEEMLQKGLDYACGVGRADCRPIEAGGTCYNPNTVVAHASYAFNSYYQRNGRGPWTCHFGGAAKVVFSQPVYGKCAFPFDEGRRNEAEV